MISRTEVSKVEQTKQRENPTIEQLKAELAREQYKIRYSHTLRSTIQILIVVSAAAILMATLFFPVFRIYGSSMSPTVNEGEIVVSLKGVSFGCGDVIVLSYNNKLLVKRVIAGPGQWVDIDTDGNVFVDEIRIDEPYLKEKAYGECNISLPCQVPDERYFVMGDNRVTSQDSRSLAVGCVAKEQIIGKAILRVWPMKQFGTLREH